ncbi:MAG: alpha-ketoacid dehydrogenase subunit beta [Spirochaetales bacterium]|uniref:Alpha-ketoacid dehydrogenase subunit beta n=1 Tax=Candidatus Thalassospirochaeta sargassi TaxID=3119039 RepID=A0AAJ1ICJ9_9SPIO|nr:alpha-ketoacid dehydrogenase subunit beta [Spirochaetales bacterium]
MAEKTFLDAIREAMSEEMRNDKNVVLVGEDIGVYGGCFGVSRGMLAEFGTEQMLETPISEEGFMDMAMGASMVGMRPIVEIMFGDFSTLVSDGLINHAAKYRFMTGGQVDVPLVFRAPFGSGTGAAAQHSQSLETMYTNTPGLKIVYPATPYDAKGLLKSAIQDDGPVLFFENKLLYRTRGEVPEGEYTVEIGKADIKREGNDVSIISYSRMLPVCLEAAAKLADEGINAEVVDLRSLKPLDTETIVESVKKTSRALVVHEAPVFGGFAGEVVSSIMESEAFYYLDSPVERLGGKEMPVPYNPDLEKQIVPVVDDIMESVRKMIKK